MQVKLLGVANVDSGVRDQRVMKFSVYGGYWKEVGV
jgi:hypothetical protein